MKALVIACIALFLSLSASAQIIINEVLYDPSNNLLDGDANGDGAYLRNADQFIEIVNIGNTPYDMRKFRICDSVIASGLKTVRHTVDSTRILPPHTALVIFGGGTPIGNFGGAAVEADRGTAGLSMQNTGEWIIIADSTGRTLLRFNSDSASDNPNESYTLFPDLNNTGIYSQHSRVASPRKFSPGTKVDGTPFVDTTSVAITYKSAFLGIYPNPNSGLFQISTEIKPTDAISIIDSQGKIVFSGIANSNTLDVSYLSKGVYYLLANSGARKYSAKFVIAN